LVETHTAKATTVGESNNAGVWGRSQGRSQPNTAEGGGKKTFRWGQIFVIFFPMLMIISQL